MIKYSLAVLTALITLAANANAQCYNADGTGMNIEQYNIQQQQLRQQQDDQTQLQNNIYQMQQQLNSLQSDEGN